MTAAPAAGVLGDVAPAQTVAPARAPGGVLFLAALLGAVLFSWALFGIFTRPVGHLAAFWPANAVLLGLMVRFPRLATWQGWCGAVLGYVAADIVTGGHPVAVFLLTSANVAGALAGHAVLSRLSEADRRLTRPLSMFYLALGAGAASSVAGIVGAVAEPVLFGGSPLTGWSFWFVAELVNYVAILPVILAYPAALVPARPWRGPWRESWHGPWRRRGSLFAVDPIRLLPALSVPLSAVASVLIGGPGAFAFPVPALLWCAVSYSVFVNTLLALLFSAWTLLAFSLGYLPLSIDINNRATLMSVRVGVTLIAFAPLVVASVMAARNELLLRLQHIASHDHLTGLLNRGAFREQADAALAAGRRPAAVLMLDIDRFKSINDTYGHAAGDRVLAGLARILAARLRAPDIIGRMGGEEFAVVLVDCSRDTACEIADRIRVAFGEAVVDLDDGRTVSATVSIGVVVADDAALDPLLAVADEALYRAKQGGRNRIELA